MNHEEERKAITEAMQRLLAGKPPQIIGSARHSHARSRGGPETQQAHPQAHRPQGPLQRRTPRPDGVPDSELRLRGEIAALTRKIKTLKEERDQYRTASETFARAIHVLTIENDNLRRDIERRRSSGVTSLPSRR